MSNAEYQAYQGEIALSRSDVKWTRRALQRPWLKLAVLVLLAFSLVAGFNMRRWTWKNTEPIRYNGDIVNGFYWGKEVLNEADRQAGYSMADTEIKRWKRFFIGYYSMYDTVASWYPDGEYYLDYPPLRLLVMSLWVKHVKSSNPMAEKGHQKYIKPLRKFNSFCELVAAVGIFLLVRHWVKRSLPKNAPYIPLFQGDSATIRILSLHKLPLTQADQGWLLGLAAGLLLWFNPAILLNSHGWPQWDVWLIPFFIFAALMASNNRWFLCGCLLALGSMFKGQMMMVAPFFIFWPIFLKNYRASINVIAGALFAVFVVTLPWTLNGSWNWLKIGYLYGAKHYPYMFMGFTNNIPALLAPLGVTLKEPLIPGFALNFQMLMRFCYIGLMILCAYGAAKHTRANNPRVLVALVTPWILMFTLLGQMHERYLLWGAALMAVAVAVRFSLVIVHLLLSFLAMGMIAHVMLNQNPTFAPRILEFLNFTHPQIAWLIIFSVGMCLYISVKSPKPKTGAR